MITITQCRICYLGHALLMERREFFNGKTRWMLDFKPIDGRVRKMYYV